MKREPVITVASLTAAVSAVITLAVSFGLNLSDDQRQAILGVVAVVAPLVVMAVRRFVSPAVDAFAPLPDGGDQGADRKSTRLNSSHVAISYAVFCLKPRTPALYPLSLHDALPICRRVRRHHPRGVVRPQPVRRPAPGDPRRGCRGRTPGCDGRPSVRVARSGRVCAAA